MPTSSLIGAGLSVRHRQAMPAATLTIAMIAIV
jgi:hypothetical protein